MTKFLFISIIILFVTICAKLVVDGEWYLVASLLIGLFISKDEIMSLWEEIDAV